MKRRLWWQFNYCKWNTLLADAHGADSGADQRQRRPAPIDGSRWLKEEKGKAGPQWSKPVTGRYDGSYRRELKLFAMSTLGEAVVSGLRQISLLM